MIRGISNTDIRVEKNGSKYQAIIDLFSFIKFEQIVNKTNRNVPKQN